MPCPNPFRLCTLDGQKQKPIRRYGKNSKLDSATAILSENADLLASSMIVPDFDEAGDWAPIEVEDCQWTDSELMEDGRPGRRRAADEQDLRPRMSGKKLKGTKLVSLLRLSRVVDDTGCQHNSKNRRLAVEMQGQHQKNDDEEDLAIVEGQEWKAV